MYHTIYRRVCVTSAAGTLDTHAVQLNLFPALILFCITVLFTAPMHYRLSFILLHIRNHTVMPCHLNLHRNNILNMFTLSCCDMGAVCSAPSLYNECECLCNMCLRSTKILSDPALMWPRKIPVPHRLRLWLWIDYGVQECLLALLCLFSCREKTLEQGFPKQWLSGHPFGLKPMKSSSQWYH